MTIIRRFVIASSIARLIMRDRSAVRIVEGHFPASHERRSHVLFEGSNCQLVLVTKPGTEWEEEERTAVPAKQGQFLLEVCAGSLACQRASIDVAGRLAHIDSFHVPERLHLVELEFDNHAEANAFAPPAWFGPEVTGEAGYDHYSMATEGQPDPPQIAVSNDAIHAVLDVLDQSKEDQALQQDPPMQCKEEAQIVEPVDEAKGNGVVAHFPQQATLSFSPSYPRGRDTSPPPAGRDWGMHPHGRATAGGLVDVSN